MVIEILEKRHAVRILLFIYESSKADPQDPDLRLIECRRNNISDIQRKLNIPNNTLYERLREFEQLKLITAETDDRNTKTKYIRLTEKGLALAEALESASEVIRSKSETYEEMVMDHLRSLAIPTDFITEIVASTPFQNVLDTARSYDLGATTASVGFEMGAADDDMALRGTDADEKWNKLKLKLDSIVKLYLE